MSDISAIYYVLYIFSYILQPKDMYCERPLPYLIGTQEWYTKWHVGLKSETDSESEKEEDSFSSSTDSDDDILKDKILVMIN